MEGKEKVSVLVICTGNSCRSHMAEGFLREYAGEAASVFSAGSAPAGYIHPLAVRVMAEEGIDISHHRSKSLTEFVDKKIDVVVTVCGNADAACPTFPFQKARYHWSFDDPSHTQGTEEFVLNDFRRVRDEIKATFRAYANDLISGTVVPSFQK